MAIRQKIIQNDPVTVEDIEIEDNIFGTDVCNLKVITTRKLQKWLKMILFKQQEN